MASVATRFYRQCTSGIRFRIKARKLLGKRASYPWVIAPYDPPMQPIINDIIGNDDAVVFKPFDILYGHNRTKLTAGLLRSMATKTDMALSVCYFDQTRLGSDFRNIFNRVRYCEIGFLSNRFAGSNRKYISYVFDTQAPHYDGTRKTDLEDGLNALSTGWWQSNREDVDFLTEYRASNAQKFAAPSQGKTVTTSDDLLVIGQCTGDQALTFTKAATTSNVDLVRLARRDHGSQFRRILFRPHPLNPTLCEDADQIAAEFGDVVQLETDEPFVHLLKGRPTVATLTSGGGLEAAIRGCPVITYGVSFYSNWGFTTDHVPCARRRAKLTVEDVFLYAYTRYANYLHPFESGRITPLQALRGS